MCSSCSGRIRHCPRTTWQHWRPGLGYTHSWPAIPKWLLTCFWSGGVQVSNSKLACTVLWGIKFLEKESLSQITVPPWNELGVYPKSQPGLIMTYLRCDGRRSGWDLRTRTADTVGRRRRRLRGWRIWGAKAFSKPPQYNNRHKKPHTKWKCNFPRMSASFAWEKYCVPSWDNCWPQNVHIAQVLWVLVMAWWQSHDQASLVPSICQNLKQIQFVNIITYAPDPVWCHFFIFFGMGRGNANFAWLCTDFPLWANRQPLLLSSQLGMLICCSSKSKKWMCDVYYYCLLLKSINNLFLALIKGKRQMLGMIYILVYIYIFIHSCVLYACDLVRFSPLE